MTKPKVEEAKPNAEEKPDDLEINSIGSLYNGPWDKKYWSSSRGKDRYPYPVGYRAVRAHNGSTYKMEIQEGPKGPLFSIIAADGQSSSGQTPYIAWEKFQKAFFPRMKIWHGKRFSCKIDGVEFFGFKNPFVQRLLRELAANVNGTAERSLVPSSFCNGASRTDVNNRSPAACPYLAKPRITGKRSRRREIVNSKSFSWTSIKRTRPEDLTSFAEPSDSVEGNKRYHKWEFHAPLFFGKEYDICKYSKASPPLVHLLPAHQEESDFSVKDSLPLDSVGFSNHPRMDAVHEEARLFVGSGNCKSTVVASNLSVDEEKPLDRTEDPDPMVPENKNVDPTVPKDSEGLTDVDLCAPDTFFTQDTTSDSAPAFQDRSASNVVISEGLLTESHPEEETATSKSNASSEMSEFDSVGQEMAKSMMTFLLPQAIPLLKKGSRKEKGTVSPSEVLPCAPSPGVMPAVNNDRMEEKVYTQNSDFGSIVPTKSIVPDSLEDDQYGDHVVNHVISSSDKAEAGQDSSDPGCLLNSHGLLVAECDTNVSESLPVCMSPYKRVSSEEIRDKSANKDECSLGVNIHSTKSNETAVDLPEARKIIDDNQRGMLNSSKASQNENAVKKTVAETGNESFTQVPHLVYTKRKAQNICPIKGNHSGPFSESIICRNSGDICAPESYPSSETLLALETLQMGSSDHNSNKDSFCAEAKIVGHSSCLNADKPSVNSKGLLNGNCPAVLQEQALVGASKEKDTLYSLDSSVTRLENHVDKDVVRHENLLELNDTETSQKQGTGLMHVPNSVPHSSVSNPHSMELHNELTGSLEFVGCYSHQNPVLSVLLSAKGTEIYICVLCGLLVDKDGSLFIYKVAIEEPRVGCPSFVGHTSVTFPIQKDYFGRIALERSSLQFTPDGQYLVLLDSIKTPYCRQGSIHCLCSTCTSNCSEENTVKIVEVKLGYVSKVASLKAVDSLERILVCEPNNLVAVGESGRLHLWVMNSSWSGQIENFVLPAEDCISPGIVELKRIPNCTHIVVGHNGFGEFSLWDISKRILVSRFSAASASICQFVPVSLFTWQIKCPVPSYSDIEEHINELVAATSNDQFSLEGEDIAVWLLVSSSSDSDAQQDYVSDDCDLNPAGRWRLALMVKNMVIFGSALDPRAAVIGASAGQGICGTCDGLVYMWELSTGNKFGAMHHFKGGSVSCIATDDSRPRPGSVAVAGDNQLLVFLHSEKSSVH
ncbi:uncharacterized protein Pyn_31565 [Prunus yedoensis var. nudiflora]|uniref:FYR C-terminal domain-containing protein n=1 Tax=Prunus yedoensis var. nudiflora TaxID=2094558 RepID=A0A314YDT0_PRUYE|nr:uncharacterized protein Pyn_31565 [Prunus yedoensis var. nudiflora]